MNEAERGARRESGVSIENKQVEQQKSKPEENNQTKGAKSPSFFFNKPTMGDPRTPIEQRKEKGKEGGETLTLPDDPLTGDKSPRAEVAKKPDKDLDSGVEMSQERGSVLTEKGVAVPFTKPSRTEG